MNYGVLTENKNSAEDDFIDHIAYLSDALLFKNWKQVMQILDYTIPICINQDYSLFKSSLIKQINPQIYRELKHAKRVSIYAQRLAKALSCSVNEIKNTEYGGFVHDLGKLIIDQRILYKETALSQREWKMIQNHPRFCCELLSWSKYFSYLIPVVEQHHEWWNGDGYPNCLKGENILFSSRVLSVVDAYDAMTCNRSYHKRIESDAAIDEIKRCAGSQFDPDIASVFTEIVLKKYNCSMFKSIQKSDVETKSYDFSELK